MLPKHPAIVLEEARVVCCVVEGSMDLTVEWDCKDLLCVIVLSV